jgi:tetratricopeptide (TPR) repeat protein
MFFPRLRKQAKWMFVALAVVFAIGFVGFGVGSGSNSGGSIGDVLRGNFHIFGGSDPVKKAQKEIRAHPQQPKGYLDLANAYEGKNQTDNAIPALERYTRMRPKDQDSLRKLASLYLSQASTFQLAAQQAQLDNPAAVVSPIFQPGGKLGQALGTDPIQAALSTKVNTAFQDAVTKMQNAQRNAIGVYKQLTRVTPNDPIAFFDLGQAAESVQDYPTAITAYKKVIALEPESSDVPAIKQHLKQLEGAAVGSTTTSG